MYTMTSTRKKSSLDAAATAAAVAASASVLLAYLEAQAANYALLVERDRNRIIRTRLQADKAHKALLLYL